MCKHIRAQSFLHYVSLYARKQNYHRINKNTLTLW